MQYENNDTSDMHQFKIRHSNTMRTQQLLQPLRERRKTMNRQ